jgi:streptomycin 6-kinase
MQADELQSRFDTRVLAWGIAVEQVRRTGSSIVGAGHRDRQPVVLKVASRESGEWFAGHVLDAFGAGGMVTALEHADGSVLLERLVPGTSIVEEKIDDVQATSVIADVIRRMSPAPPPAFAVKVETFGESFGRYLSSGASGIPMPLVAAAQRTYVELCASQATTRLLHGDLHHHNVLLDSRRGWLAIDPKGVAGELAYELGAALRNPIERPDVFAEPDRIRRRVRHFARELELDPARIFGWAFSQAVLAAIWEWEDHRTLTAGTGWIDLANTIRSMPEAAIGGTL